MEIIVGKQGQQPFAIADNNVSRKHVRITRLGDGRYQIEDLNSTNGTFVDGMRVMKKTVTADTVVQLGSSYSFRVGDALEVQRAESRMQSSDGQTQATPAFSIAHLEKVWERYEQDIDELDKQNKNINLMRGIAPVFTMVSGVVASMSGGTLAPLCWTLMGLGILVTVYAIVRAMSFDYKKARNEIQERFESEYVCPNPDCKHFMGNIKYKILAQNKQCSYCRCKLTH